MDVLGRLGRCDVRGCGRRQPGQQPRPTGEANISYWVHPAFRRRGIAPVAVRLALQFLRGHTGTRRARIMVDPDNTPSLAVAASLSTTVGGMTVDRRDARSSATHSSFDRAGRTASLGVRAGNAVLGLGRSVRADPASLTASRSAASDALDGHFRMLAVTRRSCSDAPSRARRLRQASPSRPAAASRAW